MSPRGAKDGTGRLRRYLAWRRADRRPLTPNDFLVLLVVGVVSGVALAFVGPDDDGGAWRWIRPLIVGVVVGLAAAVVTRRARGPA